MKNLANRSAAGKALAARLTGYRDRENVIVLALPRGGVPVAYEIATALHAPLDVLVVRKLGLPRHKEFAMGAIAHGGVRILNEDIIRSYRITDDVIEHVAENETKELQRREQIYRENRPWPSLRNQCVILVDDGLATGATMRAAIEAVHIEKAEEIVMAVPVAATRTLNELAKWTDETVCLLTPDPFYFVGQWYENFNQTTDEEVVRLLAQARAERAQDQGNKAGIKQTIQYPPQMTS